MPATKDKVRKRYIAFHIEADGLVVASELSGLVKDAEQHDIKADIVTERYDAASGKGLIRVRNTKSLALRSLLGNIKSLGSRQVRIKTLGTSGTIKTASSKYLHGKNSKI